MLRLLVVLAISIFALFSPWLLAPRSGRKDELTPVHLLLQTINVTYCVMLHQFSADRPAPLPIEGAAILISNHTCGIDNMLLQAASRRVLRFMIAKEFYERWPARPFCLLLGCIPVRRDGTDLAATRAALRTLEQGRVLAVFPEGRITPESGRIIGEGLPGAAYLAIKARVPVIPAYIRGTPATRDVWKALRTPSEARVFFGEPIDPNIWPQAARPDPEMLENVTRTLMSSIKSVRDRYQAEQVA